VITHNQLLAGLAATRTTDQATREHHALHAHPTTCHRAACDHIAGLEVHGLPLCGRHAKDALGWWTT